MLRSSSEAIFAATSLDNAEQLDADLYEEDEDAFAVIPVGYAASPVKEAPPPSVEGQEDDPFLVASLGDPIGLVPPELTVPDSPIDESEPPMIDTEMKTYTLWKEACTALRWFGSLAKLPLEVELQIFSLLGPTSLLKVRKTCKFGLLIAEQDELWQRLLIQDFPDVEFDRPEQSKMETYKEAYNGSVFGEARSIGFPMKQWKFSKNKIWLSSAPHQAWTFDPATSRLRSQSFNFYQWNPHMNRLLTPNMVSITYQPFGKRFFASDRATSAIITSSTAFPPTMRINCLNSATVGWTVQGKIPIPLLMVIIFGLES